MDGFAARRSRLRMTTPTKNYWQLSARGYRDSYALWLPSGRSDGVGGRASRFCSTGFRAVDRALDFRYLKVHNWSAFANRVPKT